jgi:hypothetical protein
MLALSGATLLSSFLAALVACCSLGICRGPKARLLRGANSNGNRANYNVPYVQQSQFAQQF